MKNKLTIFICLALIPIFFSGCGAITRFRYQLNPPQSGDVIFMDDFSSNGSWDIWSDEISIVDYDSDGLRFFVNQPNYIFWSRPKKEYRDVLIQVSAVKVSGPDDNQLGVICRYVNRDNFYYFTISNDGYFGIIKVVEGQHILISHDQLQYHEAIQQGVGKPNNLTVECNGPNLTLSVNDQKLAVAYDTDFDWGGVGLIVGTYTEVGVDVLFDDFVVTQP